MKFKIYKMNVLHNTLMLYVGVNIRLDVFEALLPRIYVFSDLNVSRS
jgi:hypothetical protein